MNSVTWKVIFKGHIIELTWNFKVHHKPVVPTNKISQLFGQTNREAGKLSSRNGKALKSGEQEFALGIFRKPRPKTPTSRQRLLVSVIVEERNYH
jgi:hypothetical protein